MVLQMIKVQSWSHTERWTTTTYVSCTGAPRLRAGPSPGGTPGRTLFLRHGSAPASSSSATVLTLPLRTAAWRAEVPFWKTPAEMFGIKKAVKQRCLQRTNPQMRNNMEDVRSRKPDWFGECVSRLVDYKGGDVKCFNKSESQVHFTTLISSFFFFFKLPLSID